MVVIKHYPIRKADGRPSSNVRSAGYDSRRQVLEVTFNSGKTYRYYDVPIEKYNTLFGHESPGGYFAAHIKDKHRWDQVQGTGARGQEPVSRRS